VAVREKKFWTEVHSSSNDIWILERNEAHLKIWVGCYEGN